MPRRIDLKLRLTLRVVALSACCFAAASAYAVFAVDRSARLQAEEIADVVARDLGLQQDKLHWVMPSPERFPDLQEVAALLTASGLCVAHRAKSGDVLQRICSGTRPGEADAPEFFSALYRTAFEPDREIARPVRFGNEALGEAVVSIDPASLIGQETY